MGFILHIASLPLLKVDENYQMCNLSIINIMIVKDIIRGAPSAFGLL